MKNATTAQMSLLGHRFAKIAILQHNINFNSKESKNEYVLKQRIIASLRNSFGERGISHQDVQDLLAKADKGLKKGKLPKVVSQNLDLKGFLDTKLPPKKLEKRTEPKRRKLAAVPDQEALKSLLELHKNLVERIETLEANQDIFAGKLDIL